jgi:hypothetical protein
MEAERIGIRQPVNAAMAQVGCGQRAGDRLRGDEQAARCLGRAAGSRGGRCLGLRLGLGARQAQEPARFVGNVAEVDEAAGLADDVEQIAMLAGGGVGLMFNCT